MFWFVSIGYFRVTSCLSTLVCITAMIKHKFISFSSVQIYDLSYIHLQYEFVLHEKEPVERYIFSYEWFRTKPRFDTEAEGNSGMAYFIRCSRSITICFDSCLVRLISEIMFWFPKYVPLISKMIFGFANLSVWFPFRRVTSGLCMEISGLCMEIQLQLRCLVKELLKTANFNVSLFLDLFRSVNLPFRSFRRRQTACCGSRDNKKCEAYRIAAVDIVHADWWS